MAFDVAIHPLALCRVLDVRFTVDSRESLQILGLHLLVSISLDVKTEFDTICRQFLKFNFLQHRFCKVR